MSLMSSATSESPALDECPACRTHLQDGPYRREIAFHVPETAEGALVWLCPKCGYAWPRYTSGDRGEMAKKYCNSINDRRHLR